MVYNKHLHQQRCQSLHYEYGELANQSNGILFWPLCHAFCGDIFLHKLVILQEKKSKDVLWQLKKLYLLGKEDEEGAGEVIQIKH